MRALPDDILVSGPLIYTPEVQPAGNPQLCADKDIMGMGFRSKPVYLSHLSSGALMSNRSSHRKASRLIQVDQQKAVTIYALRAACVAVCLSIGGSAYAADEVTSVLTESRPATPLRYSVGEQTYTWGMGDNVIMTGVIAGGERFDYSDSVTRVELRRDDIVGVASGNPCGVMVERLDDQGLLLAADYPSDGSGNCDMAELLASRIFNRGVLDLFSNVAPDAKNIERADFLFDHGVLAPLDSDALAQAGHVIGEKRGNNAVKIAAVLELDVFGQPASYGPLVLIGGSACPGTGICYAAAGDALSYALFQNEFLSPQGYPTVTELSDERDTMAFISAEALGLDAGQLYYGFSLFADDVDSSVHILTDPTTFPDDTGFDSFVAGDGADVYGGLAGYFLGDSLNVASGRVFLDNDADGFFGESDAGISDIGIVIHADSDNNGVFDPLVDEALHESINSDLAGVFQLPGLADGNYFVALDEQDVDIPAGLVIADDANTVAVVIGANDVSNINFAFANGAGGGLGGTDAGGTDAGGTDAGGTDADGTNAATVAVSDTYAINQGETLIAAVLDNDTDASGRGLTLVSVSETPNASTEVVGETVVYTPDFGFYGAETFRYTIEDADGTASSGTVTVNVERFSDIDTDLINDFDQCAETGVDCDSLGLETGVHGSGLGSLAWQSLVLLVAAFGLMVSRRRSTRWVSRSELRS